MEQTPNNDLNISYILNELGEDREMYFRAVAPPIIQTSNFAFKKVNDLRNVFIDESSDWLYSRGLNPTVEILRKKIAALDHAEDALVFNSGAAAMFAAVFANVKSGDHIVCVRNPYTWTKRLLQDLLPKFNVTHTFIDGRETKNLAEATNHNTTLYILESPTGWGMEMQNLEEVATLAKSKNIITICDNSYCSPIYQQPIKWGIDLVLQSATKYLSGHSDVVAGVLSGSHAMIERIFKSEYMNIGSGIQPFNAWLMIRGLRTLPVRIDKITRTTKEVINFLKEEPLVDKVIFPFDEDYEQLALAKKQMSGACGLAIFSIKAKHIATIEKFCESLKHILMAVSWGGHESLIIPGCASINPETFDPGNFEHTRLRLYVGLEEADYIISDLAQGFDRIRKG